MNDRLSKVRHKLIHSRFNAALISSVPNITYLTNFSSFSKEEREAYIFIAKDKQYILTDGRYSQAVKTLISDFELIEISTKFSFEKALKRISKKHKIKKLGIEEDNLTVKEHRMISKHCNDLYHYTADHLRIIKDKKEIETIERACSLGDKTFNYILGKIKEGIAEKELTIEIELFIKKHRADVSFPPIVAFAKNSAFPHHKTSYQRLKTKDIILIDFGVKIDSYCSDMTRTVFFGSPNAKYKKMYQTVLDAQQKAINALANKDTPLRRSILAKKVDKVARDYIISKNYKTIPHSVGHGIGLEVHEAPRLSPNSKDILKPGMVFTIEPGIYLPGFGGVRIEDVVVLEEPCPRFLTRPSRGLIKL